MNSITRCEYPPLPPVYSASMGELVKVMLRKEPSRRPAVSQVRKFGNKEAHSPKGTILVQIVAATVLQADILKYMEYIKTLTQDTSSTTGSGSGGSQLELRFESLH